MLGRALLRAGGGSLTHLYLHNSAAITDAGIRQLVKGLAQLKVLQLTAFTAATASPPPLQSLPLPSTGTL